MARRAGTSGTLLLIHDTERVGFMAIANLAFRASHSPFFGYVAQDAFAGREWLSLALTALGEEGVLLGFNDGKWAGALAAFGIAKRAWADRNYAGDFFYSGYTQHFADAELTLLAMQAGHYCYEPNSVLVELDWDKDARAVNAADRALFAKRKASGFDGRVVHPQLLELFH